MVHFPKGYKHLFHFLEEYLPDGYSKIDPDSSFMESLENMMKAQRQFFFIGDMIRVKVLYTSQGSLDMLGLDSVDVDPATFFIGAHPDDLIRVNLARTKLFNLAQELYIEQKKSAVMSTNFRISSSPGQYMDILVQCFLFYTEVPYKTVFLLQINTDISQFSKSRKRFHYYIGDDSAMFRYPDEILLSVGHVFSNREYEILQMVASGLNSEQIAERLFLSVHTVDTHRRNILRKAGSASTSELIFDLKKQGLL